MADNIDQGQDGTVDGDVNPMYQEYLEQIPEDYRDQVQEVFQDWDKNVTQRFQAISEEVSPYRELIDNYDPRVLTAGVNLLSQIADDPQRVYDQLAESYNLGNSKESDSDKKEETSVADTENGWEAQLSAQQQMIDELRMQIESQSQERSNDKELEEFQAYMENLRETKGDYDSDYVLSKIAAGTSPEDAVDAYHELVTELRGSQEMQEEKPPVVLGGSSGVESSDINFAEISDKETKDIVTQLLKQANS